MWRIPPILVFVFVVAVSALVDIVSWDRMDFGFTAVNHATTFIIIFLEIVILVTLAGLTVLIRPGDAIFLPESEKCIACRRYRWVWQNDPILTRHFLERCRAEGFSFNVGQPISGRRKFIIWFNLQPIPTLEAAQVRAQKFYRQDRRATIIAELQRLVLDCWENDLAEFVDQTDRQEEFFALLNRLFGDQLSRSGLKLAETCFFVLPILSY